MSVENIAVLDAGSYTFKAGLSPSFNGEESPSVVTPSAVVNTQADSGAAITSNGSSAAGGQLIAAVEGGAVTNWDAYEAILDHILYDRLGWQIGDEGALLASESLFTPRAEREVLTQLVFEHNNVAGFLLSDAPTLSLFAVGKLSGCVVDVGHTKTDIATVSEGQLQLPSARRLELGMRTLSLQLQSMLQGRCNCSDIMTVDALRNAVIRVADSSNEAEQLLGKASAAVGETYTLPDGQAVSISSEGVQLGELLVDGRPVCPDLVPAAAVVHSACASVPDAAARKSILDALMVCGGGSAAAGLSLRLLRELRMLLPPSGSPALLQAPEHMASDTLRYSAWLGAAIQSKVAFQQSHYVTKLDYEEMGPIAVHRKCY